MTPVVALGSEGRGIVFFAEDFLSAGVEVVHGMYHVIVWTSARSDVAGVFEDAKQAQECLRGIHASLATAVIHDAPGDTKETATSGTYTWDVGNGARCQWDTSSDTLSIQMFRRTVPPLTLTEWGSGVPGAVTGLTPPSPYVWA